MSILDDVTPAQREAITHIDGPLLVVAGAGSGKTRVITRRVAYLIQQGVSPYDILAITFTNKAAEEMRHRIEQMGSPRGVWMSTFHSMCARMLRRNHDLIGRSESYVIFDSADQLACVKQAMKELEIDSSTHSPNSILGTISRAKNDFLSVEQFADTAGDYFETVVAKVYRKYAQALAVSNALDFDDLLMYTAQLLRDNEAFRSQWQDRFKYILIDEYQDTNHAQYLITKHLAARHRNICATGDPDQSIYGWRGADISNILDFQKDYPHAKLVKLEENFRSTQVILDAAHGLISRNRKRIDKRLFTSREGGSNLLLIRCSDEEHEGHVVASEIEKRRAAGRDYGDIAIFYRTNAQSRAIEAGLRANQIPYMIVGAVEFYNRKEVKDIVAYLRLIVNEHDDVAATRVINVPARGIGAGSVGKLRTWAAANNTSLAQAVFHAEEAGLGGARLKSVQAFAGMLAELRELPDSPVAEIVRTAIGRSGYELSLSGGKDPRAEERIQNVRELASGAAEWDEAHPDGDLLSFLENVALVSDTDALPDEASQVSLMTLHSAKGLEFPVVFFTGLEEGLVPHMNAMRDPNGEEEERRLCYVGITRTKEELVLSYALRRRRFGLYEYCSPSPFIDEIPQELLERSDIGESFGPGADDEDDDEPYSVADDDFEYSQEPPSKPAGLALSGMKPRGPDATPAPKTSKDDDIQRGSLVQHSKFGRGVVMSISGSGETRSAVVQFGGERKTLVLKYAKLKRLS